MSATLLTELTWESFSNNIRSAGHHFLFTFFHIFGESCHSQLGPHCPPLRGRLRGCKEGAAYLLQEPLFFCLFSKRLLFDLLLTLVSQGSRCPGEQTQALVTCHQETPAISWDALCRFTDHSHISQKYTRAVGALSPGRFMYLIDCCSVLRVHKSPSHP